MTAMKLHRQVPNGTWLGVMFVVLAGVLGMHGLNTHGVQPDPAMGMSHAVGSFGPATTQPSPHTTSAAAGSHASTSMSAMAAAQAVPADALISPDSPQRSDDGGGMAGLCMMVLAAAVLLLLHRRTHTSSRRLPGRLFQVAAVAVCGRDRDPPSLTLLSIRRC